MCTSFKTLNNTELKPKLRRLGFGVSLILALVLGRESHAVTLTGEQSGVWDFRMSPIRIVGDIRVPEGDTLLINPGVQISFEGNFALEVDGLLIAEGSENNGGRVIISGSIQWRGIYINRTANPDSRISFCDISNTWIGVQTEQVDITINNCLIDAYATGINVVNASPVIRDNARIRARSDRTQASDVRAISIFGESDPQIINNQLVQAVCLQRGDAFGIWINSSSPRIEGNWIEASSNQASVAIYGRGSDKCQIIRNIIRTSTTNTMRGVWLVYSTAINIINNNVILVTTAQNAVGLLIDIGSTATIINNNVIGNFSSIGDSTEAGVISDDSDYNNYYFHFTNHVGNWQGGRHEINADPMFLSEVFGENTCYRYPEDSPCVDSGSPAIADPGDRFRTVSDIGRYAFIWDHDPNENDTNVVSVRPDPATIADGFALHPAFPNPFNRTTTISFELALPGPASVTVFDLSGRRIQSLWNSQTAAGVTSINWSAEGLSAGEYLIRLDASGQTQTSRLLYLP